MNLLLENVSHEDLKKYLKEFYNYAKKELQLDVVPRLFLKNDEENSSNFLGKTGYYDAGNQEIHIFITGRHAKDIVRSFAHELVHHDQNIRGMNANIDMSVTSDPAYAQKDPALRNMERDAFERGNMLFRDWCDMKKMENKNMLSEAKKKVKSMTALMKKIHAAGGAAKTAAVAQSIQQKMEKNEEKKVSKDYDGDGKVESGSEEYLGSRDAAIKKAMGKTVKGKAKKQAKKDSEHRTGKDMKKEQGLGGIGEYVEKLEEQKESVHPYPQLLQEKPRLMQEAFNKKEDLVYQELIRRFIKK